MFRLIAAEHLGSCENYNVSKGGQKQLIPQPLQGHLGSSVTLQLLKFQLWVELAACNLAHGLGIGQAYQLVQAHLSLVLFSIIACQRSMQLNAFPLLDRSSRCISPSGNVMAALAQTTCTRRPCVPSLLITSRATGEAVCVRS